MVQIFKNIKKTIQENTDRVFTSKDASGKVSPGNIYVPLFKGGDTGPAVALSGKGADNGIGIRLAATFVAPFYYAGATVAHAGRALARGGASTLIAGGTALSTVGDLVVGPKDQYKATWSTGMARTGEGFKAAWKDVKYTGIDAAKSVGMLGANVAGTVIVATEVAGIAAILTVAAASTVVAGGVGYIAGAANEIGKKSVVKGGQDLSGKSGTDISLTGAAVGLVKGIFWKGPKAAINSFAAPWKGLFDKGPGGFVGGHVQNVKMAADNAARPFTHAFQAESQEHEARKADRAIEHLPLKGGHAARVSARAADSSADASLLVI